MALTNILYKNNKVDNYKSYENDIMFENKYMFGPISNKYPMLFEITANKKPENINISSLIMNAYKSYKNMYDIEHNISQLLKSQYFKKDTQVLHIAIHHNTGYKLKELEELIQTNIIYKEYFESTLYDLYKLSDFSDKVVEEVHVYFENDTKINYLLFLLKEIEKLLYKYH